jgi:hypothetical protein
MLRKCLVGLTFGAILAAPAAAQTVDELIAKNLAVRGGLDKMKAVQSMRISGKMTMGPGMEAPFVLEKKRPNRLRMEFTVQGMTGVQAFDGTTAWGLMPFGGRKDPEAAPADETKLAEEQADFDGPLVDYKAKGHTVELVGKEPVEGSDTYKLKVTLKNGSVRYVFLDAESFIQVRAEGKNAVRGNEVEFETSLGDYKEVGGLMFPHVIENGAKGRPEKQKIIIEKIELGPAVDDARFKMPTPAPAPAPVK